MITESFTAEPEERDDDPDTLDSPATPEADADPVHLAKCAECATAVKFRSNVTGTGFFLVDADPDAVFGVGEHGRPVCPNGHGEMSIADEQLKSVPEAFADAQTMLKNAEGGPVQRSLPGVFPAFNYEGVFKEIVEQAQCVERLKAEHDAAKSEAADAKKALDKGAELLMKMTLEFERRRKEKPEADGTQAAAALADSDCTWTAKHLGALCPICSREAVPIVVSQYLGDASKLSPPDAQGHIDDVEKLLLGMEIDEAVEALENVDTFIEAAVVGTWTGEERAAVEAYANALLDKNSNVPDVVLPERPEVLGVPHIPVKAIDGEHQVCQFCEVVIHAASDEERDPFEVTDYVGVDCKRKPSDAPRYPETKKGKKKAPAAKAKAKKATR